MSVPLSKSQLEKLGRRLRNAEVPTEEDMALLQDFRAAHDPALAMVEATLQDLGLRPTSRLKTPGTIIDKLAREKTRLGTMHDIAGVRVVDDVTLDGQDAIAAVVRTRLGGEVIDRRRKHSYGYRAVHIVVRTHECFVEVQIRTLLQNLWAQMMESLGDRIGRGVRYGIPPTDPDNRSIFEAMLTIASGISKVERGRADLSTREGRLAALDLGTAATDEELAAFEAELEDYWRLKQSTDQNERLLRDSLPVILKRWEGGGSA